MLPLPSAYAGWASNGTESCSDAGPVISCAAGIPGVPGLPGALGGIPTSGTASSSSDASASATKAVSTSAAPPTCGYIPYPQGGPPPAGMDPNGAWYIDTCDIGSSMAMATGVTWLVNGAPAPPAGSAPTVPPPPTPAAAGAEAASELGLPDPTIAMNPSGTGYVNVAEWLWIEPSLWHPYTVTAEACDAGGCTTATAVATPKSVTWDTGDGARVVCQGPGVAYDTQIPPNQQHTYCQHTYRQSSAGEPAPPGEPNAAAYPVTATVTWAVSWSSSGGATGTLPDARTAATTKLRVEQIEAVQDS